MRMKCDIVIRYLWILVFLSGWSAGLRSQEIKDMSYSQLFFIPENAENNDDCGKFYSYFTYKPVDKIVYKITGGNTTGIFKIDETTGAIKINDKSNLKAGQYNIQITCYDNTYSDIDTARIIVISASKCIFIDPLASANGNGSRISPYNTWNAVNTFNAGYAYFQKRNTTFGASEINIGGPGGTLENQIFIGAYGSGQRPVLDGTKLDATMAGIWIGSTTKGASYVNVSSFIIHSSKGIKVERTCDHIRIYDLEVYNCRDNAGIYLKYQETPTDRAIIRYNEVYNCVSHDNGDYHGIKANPGTLLKNCMVYNNGGNGISSFNNSTIDHCYSHHNKQYGLEADGYNINIINSRVEYTYAGVYANNSSNVRFKNNIAENNYYGIGIDFYTSKSVVEDNISRKNTYGIDICGGSSEIIVQRNIVANNKETGISVTKHSAAPGLETNISIFYNVVYGNTSDGITISEAEGVYVYNNTVINKFNIGVNASSYEFYNNIFTEISGIVNNSYNLINPDSKYFVDFANANFRLTSNAVSLIDKGKNLGLQFDFDGHPISNLPDIGAFEYNADSQSQNPPPVTDTNVNTNNRPVINDQEFSLLQKNISNGEYSLGIVKAFDNDIEQSLNYKIISGNSQEAFLLNPVSGELLVDKPQLIDFSSDSSIELIVETTDNANPPLSASATIKVMIIPAALVYYIDPTNNKDKARDGSLLHPYASWNEVKWINGATYLQRRGTIASEDKINILASQVILGTYGSGEIPQIISNTSDYVIRMFDKEKVTIKDLNIKAENALSCIYIFGENSDSNIVENCMIEGAQNGIRAIDGKLLISRYNTFLNNTEAIFSYAQVNEIYYNVFRSNVTAIHVDSYLSELDAYNNVFFDNQYGISNSYSNISLYNNIFYLSTPGSVAVNDQFDKMVSDNNIFYPEQIGFIKIGDKTFSTLTEYSKATGMDLNSYTADPLFIDPYNNNFQVHKISPAIDAGKFLGILRDIKGTSIPIGGAPDIGSYESEKSTQLLLDDLLVSKDEIALKVYPNPSQGIVNIEINKDKPFTNGYIRIADLTGKTVYSTILNVINNNLNTLNLSHLPQGIYMLFIEYASKSICKEIILE
jgi:hypothetical protein